MSTSRISLAKWLLESRALAHLSRREAAAAIGISRKTLERLELGHHEPKADYIIQLARLYKTAPPGGTYRDTDVPRGTPAAGNVGSERLASLARDFEVEMIQVGATRFEADHVRERLAAFWSAPIFDGGETAASLTPADQEREFRLYMDYSLRPWILERVARRSRPKHQTIVEYEADAPSTRASARPAPATRQAVGGRSGRPRRER